MSIRCSNEACTGCSACFSVCPSKCISMAASREGFLYPKIDSEKCTECRLCEDACPLLNTTLLDSPELPKFYITYALNDLDRVEGASGGTFHAIAYRFIKETAGVVFGAVYDDDFNVYIRSAEIVDELKAYQKSKYLQSEIRESFASVRNYLLQDRYVLYSAMPCQIYGLLSYLRAGRTDTEKLYTIDLICKGVPSPKVFHRYLAYQETQMGSPPVTTEFRHKRLLRNSYEPGIKIGFENRREYFKIHSDDLYGICYWGEISSRPSCYECKFKTISRESDLTLGDCWFTSQLLPGEQDTRGVTLAIVQSPKGETLLRQSRENLFCSGVDPIKAAKSNGGMLYSSAKKHEMREAFFNDLDNKSIDFRTIVERYFGAAETKNGFVSNIKEYLRTNIKKHSKFYERYSRQRILNSKNKEFENRIKREIPECALSKLTITRSSCDLRASANFEYNYSRTKENQL